MELAGERSCSKDPGMDWEVIRPALYPQHYNCSWSGPKLSTLVLQL